MELTFDNVLVTEVLYMKFHQNMSKYLEEFD